MPVCSLRSRLFNAFTGDNDPYCEHDCAILPVDGIEVLFKIEYYDRATEFGSPDPAAAYIELVAAAFGPSR